MRRALRRAVLWALVTTVSLAHNGTGTTDLCAHTQACYKLDMRVCAWLEYPALSYLAVLLDYATAVSNGTTDLCTQVQMKAASTSTI